MQGHAIHALQGLSARLRAVGETATRVRTRRDGIGADLDACGAEVASLTVRIEQRAKVGELFRTLMDKLVEEQRKTIEGVVSEGLKAILYDQQLTFETDLVTRANRIEIIPYFKRGTGPLAIRDHPLQAFGGGATSIASLTLLVLALIRLKRYPLLLLDESLLAISEEYVEPTGRFLQQLCAHMKIDLLLVTHKPGFLDHADVAYQGSEEGVEAAEGMTRLAVRKLRGKPLCATEATLRRAFGTCSAPSLTVVLSRRRSGCHSAACTTNGTRSIPARMSMRRTTIASRMGAGSP